MADKTSTPRPERKGGHAAGSKPVSQIEPPPSSVSTPKQPSTK